MIIECTFRASEKQKKKDTLSRPTSKQSLAVPVAQMFVQVGVNAQVGIRWTFCVIPCETWFRDNSGSVSEAGAPAFRINSRLPI